MYKLWEEDKNSYGGTNLHKEVKTNVWVHLFYGYVVTVKNSPIIHYLTWYLFSN